MEIADDTRLLLVVNFASDLRFWLSACNNLHVCYINDWTEMVFCLKHFFKILFISCDPKTISQHYPSA